jgi:UDP-N-acetylmuramate dehydrogenase
MQIQENFSLREYNSFGIDVSARFFSTFSNTDELAALTSAAAEFHKNNDVEPLLVLGGGSNILFTHDRNGWVLKNEIPGIEKINEDENHVYVAVGAGESWHKLVLHTIENDWAGLENLSLIPGNTGASPMQNIGAYGVELKDVFFELEAWHLQDKTLVKFSAADCAFGYRESVFKNKYRNQFVITKVIFRLNKTPQFNISYGAIKEELEKAGVTTLTIRAVSDAVVRIRKSKLPDPAVIGNAGSFFKNPEVPAEQFERLKSTFPSIVGYPATVGKVKLAAGWLIEQAGWKGFRMGDAGCHAKQALVLVNYGAAKGSEILSLSEKIKGSVAEKFGVMLHTEVNVF